METKEILNITAALIILSIVSSFYLIVQQSWNQIPIVILFSAIVLIVAITAKKIMASWLDADVEHEIWKFSRYGFRQHWHLKSPVPGGIIFPLFLSLISLGFLKFSAILSFETTPSKYRAAKRHGYYSFTEMTDWHNALIASAGIIAMFIIAIISYFTNFEYLGKIAIFYAFSNMLPLTKFDGNQIFFGSRILYAILGVITIIFMLYALFL